MEITTKNKLLHYGHTMYPSLGYLFVDERKDVKFPEYTNLFGYVLSGEIHLPNGKYVEQENYFSYYTMNGDPCYITGTCAIFARIGYRGLDMIGSKIEDSGRLCYIDGCSDTILIPPHRLGDPSLNALFFPKNTEQTHHIHPSLRLGLVIRGKGIADTESGKFNLEEGMLFSIEERERHRFITEDSEMVVLAYHPDGDWGPTDHNHIMLNRTFLNR